MPRAGVIGLFGLVLVGCRAESELPTSVDEEDFANFLAIEACSDAFDCECPDLRWESRGDCLDELRMRRDDESFVAQNNGLTYDPECVAELIYRARELQCEVALSQEATDEQREAAACPEPCKPYYGDKREGERCTRLGVTVPVDDCAQGLACAEGRQCAPLCDRSDPIASGEPCRAGIEELGSCEAGSYCDEASGTCVVPPGLGQQCETRCAEGAWCDRAPEPPVCVETLDAGQPCVLDESCVSGTCENDVCTPARALVCP